MVKRYIKTVEENIWIVIASHQLNWDARLPTFLLAYRASTHYIMGLIPASLVFGNELRLPCGLLYAPLPKKGQHTIDHGANLADHLHDNKIVPANIWSWPVTGWKLVTRDWITARVIMRATDVTLSPNQHEEKIGRAPILVGGPVPES
jgi:hypothetical protein